jgi:hypothetical protein
MLSIFALALTELQDHNVSGHKTYYTRTRNYWGGPGGLITDQCK